MADFEIAQGLRRLAPVLKEFLLGKMLSNISVPSDVNHSQKEGLIDTANLLSLFYIATAILTSVTHTMTNWQPSTSRQNPLQQHKRLYLIEGLDDEISIF